MNATDRRFGFPGCVTNYQTLQNRTVWLENPDSPARNNTMTTAQSNLSDVTTHGPLKIHRGGGLIAIFGAMFLVPGVLLASTAIRGTLPIGAGLLGVVFTCVGALLAFGRLGVTLDRASGTFTTWRWFFMPWESEPRKLSEFTAVQLTRERQGSGRNACIVYPVRICRSSADRADIVTLKQPRTYREGRTLAEQVARYVELPLADRTAGETVRQPDELDQSVAQRLQRAEARVAWPSEMTDSRIQCQQRGRDLDMTLPASGLQPQHVLIIGVMLPSSMLVMAILFVFTQGMDAKFVGLIMGVELLLVTLVIGACLVLARSRTTIVLNSNQLTVHRSFCGLASKTHFPLSELEEMSVQGPSRERSDRVTLLTRQPYLLLRSDRQTARVGRGLATDELNWLQQAIESTLCRA